ncbi:MAG: TPM domain-containing protein [Janthinobacterium sp.]|nr:TPM domain-containing protein [Janthinobacterium sp.]
MKHLRGTPATARQAFPERTLKAIEAAIADGEAMHQAEVRLIVEAALTPGMAYQGVSNRERARELFAHYGVWDTEDNVGLLIYINLAEHQVDIVADRHVGRRVTPEQWQAVCRTMTRGFKDGNYHDSTLDALKQLNTLLQSHFPADGPRGNQLPNEPILL